MFSEERQLAALSKQASFLQVNVAAPITSVNPLNYKAGALHKFVLPFIPQHPPVSLNEKSGESFFLPEFLSLAKK